ncbi:hypothetical protein KJ762_04885 [bacterium]|nr:hypothetical protein [bacterium]MBU1633830.1 hypothetical protein [bacterium]MBU1872917.1 hypothetical protein [bacterium]
MLNRLYLLINKFTVSSGFLAGLIVVISLSPALALGDKYAGEFLKIGMGVREMSLGGSVVAAAQNASAVYWNPAALAAKPVLSGEFMHTEEFAGVLNLDYVALALPGSADWSYGFGFFRSGVDGIPDTRSALIDENGNGELDPGERLNFGKIGTFGASENALFFAMARPMNARLNIGGTIKTLYKSLGISNAWGVGFDLAAQFQLLPDLFLGAILRDVTTTFLYYPDGDNEFIAPSLQLGAAYSISPVFLPVIFRPSLGLDINLEGETNQSDLNLGFISAGVRLGLEMQVKEHIMLRIGRDNLGSTHVGFGLNTPIGSIDYGLAMGGSYAELGQSHRIGLTLHFAELGRYVKEYL